MTFGRDKKKKTMQKHDYLLLSLLSIAKVIFPILHIHNFPPKYI